MKEKLKNILPKSDFAKNVAILTSGTALAQAILILVSPILSRVYNDADFGVLTLYMSVTSILSTLLTGRYELAIMLPKEEKEAVNLTALSVVVSIFVSIFVYIILLFFNTFIPHLLNATELSIWLWIIPLNALLIACYQSLYFYSNRKKYYKSMATSRVVKNTGVASFSIGAGLIRKGSFGLVAGRFFGDILAVIIILAKVIKSDFHKFRLISRRNMQEVSFKYKRFPQFLLFSNLVSVLNGEIPTFMIKTFYDWGVLGQYSWSYRLVGLPSSIIAKNMGDVFRQRATEDYHKYGNFKSIFVKTVKNMFLYALIPFILAWFLLPTLFSFFLGSEWIQAGYFARILIIGTFFSFVITPIDKAALIVGNTAYILTWHILRLALNLIAFLIIKYNNCIIETYLYILVAINVCMYLVELFVCYWFSLGNDKIFKKNEKLRMKN